MSIISQSIKDEFASSVLELYNDLKSQVIIHKAPTQTITNINNNPIYGYGNESDQSNITYTPVSGIFEACVRYDNPLSQNADQNVRELNYKIPKGG